VILYYDLHFPTIVNLPQNLAVLATESLILNLDVIVRRLEAPHAEHWLDNLYTLKPLAQAV
jgi:hypothetical protein